VSDLTDIDRGSGLTAERFQVLLDWLDPDAERAAQKYEVIRRGLITIFVNRKYADAEGLADETIDRVVRKLPEIKANYSGDPARYFYGVAKHVYLSHLRRERPLPPPHPLPEEDAAQTERMLECLSKCLDTLSPDSRELILRYYEEQKQAKIDSRKKLAMKLHVKSGVLRARMRRIRMALEKCVTECLRAREE